MLIFIAGFIYVFLLGFQQQNITHEHHGKSVLTSFGLSAATFYLVQGLMANDAATFILWYGSGSAIGASLSIVAHKWFRKPALAAGEWL